MLTAWLTQEKDALWFRIEQGDCPNLPLDPVPFLNQDGWRINQINNMWVRNTFKIWSKVRKKLNLPFYISKVMKIAHNIDFPPSKLDVSFKKWEERGLIRLDQLFMGENLMSYE